MEREEQLQQYIEDAAAFIRLALKNGRSNAFVVNALLMDIFGLEDGDVNFVPRVNGSAVREQEGG